MQEDTRGLIDWYQEKARPFLQKHRSPDKLAEFDRDCERLRKANALLNDELSVCFLGNSGVGKSTLINALVGCGQAVVPAGGVGPLTAQALVVRFGDRPKIEIEYHGAERLNQLAFGLENAWKTELGIPGIPLADLTGEEGEILVEDSPTTADAGDLNERELQRRNNRSVAEMLIAGKQSTGVSVRYLVDGLRDALGHARPWGTAATTEDAERIAQLRAALALAKQGKSFVAEGTARELEPVLDVHACGFLAPLIRQAVIWCNSSLLASGINLVDLPGLGVIGDPRPEVTRKFVRESAGALILVVDNRGITEPVAQLLRASEFLTRLLHTSDEPEGSPVLIVAVTKIDDIANTRRAKDRDRSFASHFAEVCEEMVPYIRNQLRSELQALWGGDDDLHSSKAEVIDRLIRTLLVHPVSAVQFEALISEDGARLTDVGETNIPAITTSIKQVRSSQNREHTQKIQSYALSLLSGVVSETKLIEAQWSKQEHRAGEIEQLRSDLEVFMLPLRLKFATLQGQYREFLRHTAPQRIADLVRSGKEQSKNRIGKYLANLGTYHWATLRASVRRGGRYSGKSNIDLQQEFALCCEEPIAQAWGQEILKDIRRRTNEYASQSYSLVEQIAAWAAEQGARVQQNIVEAQKNSIKADAERLKTVGRDMIKEVREKNSTELNQAIDRPIRRKCKSFVDAHYDVNPGVKDRIIKLFDKLASEIPDEAEIPASQILIKFFREVEGEILQALGEHQNPLDAMSEAIVASQEQYLLRSDAQKRKPILDEAAQVLATLPSAQKSLAA